MMRIATLFFSKTRWFSKPTWILTSAVLLWAAIPALAQEDPYGEAFAKVLQEGDSAARRAKDALPAFEAVTLEGERLSQGSFAGTVLLIDFWGTWCPPCVASIPHLQTLHERSEKDPFVLLSISNDHDGDALRSFVAKHDMNWPQVWDEDRELTRRIFRISRYPTFVVVGHDGKVRYQQSGWGSEVERQLDAEVGRAIRAAKKAAKTAR
ncbi:MAG: TlpA family protein disulfide reductase [bacterium]|nr:TlpA family protein disulfide reductase [bacterium]